MNELRGHYGLQGFKFKQIDAFLYIEGGKLLAAKEKQKQSKA